MQVTSLLRMLFSTLLERLAGHQSNLFTHIDVVLLVALVQIEQYGSLMQVSQHGHVLHTFYT